MANEKIEALKKRYLRQLEEWAQKLDVYAGEPQPWSDEMRQSLRSAAHNLAGSGGTYGFDDISASALAAQEKLDAMTLDYNALIVDIHALSAHCRKAVSLGVSSSPAEKNVSEGAPVDTLISDLPVVLVVDDDPAMRSLVGALLGDDARIVTADSAERALASMSTQMPALIILDDKMAEGMSGIDMLKQMQNMTSFSETPVVMLTASDRPHEIMRGLVQGAVDYITKPFDPNIFVKKMRARLSRLSKAVLIVDDDAPVRDLLAYKFRAVGCRVIVAENGAEALSLMRLHRPGLALLDRMMPGEDGFVVLQKMREVPELSQIPVIFLTAKHSESDIIEGLNNGAADYIVKPFNPEEVVARCIRFLQAG